MEVLAGLAERVKRICTPTVVSFQSFRNEIVILLLSFGKEMLLDQDNTRRRVSASTKGNKGAEIGIGKLEKKKEMHACTKNILALFFFLL